MTTTYAVLRHDTDTGAVIETVSTHRNRGAAVMRLRALMRDTPYGGIYARHPAYTVEPGTPSRGRRSPAHAS